MDQSLRSGTLPSVSNSLTTDSRGFSRSWVCPQGPFFGGGGLFGPRRCPLGDTSHALYPPAFIRTLRLIGRRPTEWMRQGLVDEVVSRLRSSGRRCRRSPRSRGWRASLSRRNCQTFSTGFNSGRARRRPKRVMFSGTTSAPARCHPSWSKRRTAWASGKARRSPLDCDFGIVSCKR